MKDGMGHTKYPTMVSVVKAVLTLTHGKAGVERNLPDSVKTVKTVTVDRSRLSKACINNLQIGTDGSEVFDSLPHHVLITSSFGSINPWKLLFGSRVKNEKGSWKKKTGATSRRFKFSEKWGS